MDEIEKLKKHYKNSADVKFKENKDYSLIYCEGLSNVKEVEEYLLQRIARHARFDPTHLFSSLLTINKITDTSYEQLDNLIFSGLCLLYHNKHYYTINVIDVPKRTPDQSTVDITITGPRDSFIENLETNVALVRKRMKTSKLHYEKFTLGTHTKTQIGLLYMSHVCSKESIDEVSQRLNELKSQDITSNGQLRALLFDDHKHYLFPRMMTTTRPDYCVTCLLKGKFVMIVDNFNNANIAPATIPLFIDLSDDINDHYITTFINRFLYFFSAFIAIFLMPFILALYSFHPQSIPFLWLSNILSIQKGMVLPVYLEIIFATLLFELFRVAGTRFPAGISTTLLVIGGVLLGQNLTSSGFIGYDIMFLSSFSIICNYSISNDISFNSIITVYKIFAFICALLFGLFGFTFALILITLYTSQLQSYGQDMIDGEVTVNFNVFKRLFESINFNKKVGKLK